MPNVAHNTRYGTWCADSAVAMLEKTCVHVDVVVIVCELFEFIETATGDEFLTHATAKIVRHFIIYMWIKARSCFDLTRRTYSWCGTGCGTGCRCWWRTKI